VFGAIIDKSNSEPAWVQGGVVYQVNLFLQKAPQNRPWVPSTPSCE
jgi:hypothetical protein